MSSTTEPPKDGAEVDFASLKVGQTIGRYEILSILGQGGFGITYRARDIQLGRDVAIKEYLPSALAVRQDGVTVLPRSTKLAEDFSWGRQRFVDEGRTLASLHRAPAIVHVFDFLEANGTAYIVMELLSGETMEDRLRREGKLDAEAIERILWPLLDGLEQVHSTGFLHRDIKPANILLDAEGKPTLIDFGASRAAMAGRTTAMTAIFTPGYAASEQMTSARQGPWTDIYGLSATLYHAITGEAPPSAFDRLLDDSYQPLSKLAPPGLPAGICAGIDAGLAVKATDRPQSIAGWRPILGLAAAPQADATVVIGKAAPAAVTQVVRGRGSVLEQAPAGPATATPPPAARKAIGLWLGLAAVLLILLGGGGYFALAPRGPDPEAVKARAAADAAEAARVKAEQEASALRAEREKAEREAAEKARQAAEAERQKQLEEETRRKIEAEYAEKQKAEADKKRADDEARAKAEQEAEARRKAIEFVEGNFDHFGKSLLYIGLVGRTPDLHLQGVDIVDDPALRQLAVNALASQPRNLRCRQTDRLTDGTPLYRCLITQLNAKPPLDAVPDSDRVDLALALVRNGVLLASCDAPRIYADAEDEARGRNAALWSRVKVLEYKKRCAR